VGSKPSAARYAYTGRSPETRPSPWLVGPRVLAANHLRQPLLQVLPLQVQVNAKVRRLQAPPLMSSAFLAVRSRSVSFLKASFLPLFSLFMYSSLRLRFPAADSSLFNEQLRIKTNDQYAVNNHFKESGKFSGGCQPLAYSRFKRLMCNTFLPGSS
jgi:hypothetical protein